MASRTFVALLGIGLVACAGSPPPAAPAPVLAPPPTSAPVVASPRECETREACIAEGKAKLDKGDLVGARESDARACHLGDTPSCTNGGALYLELPADKGRAESLLAHACAEGKGDADGCAVLLGLHVDGKATPPDVLLREADEGCAPGSDDPRRKRARGEACAIAGHSYERGVGTAPSEERALAAYKKGCEMGHEPSCGLGRALVASIERRKEAEAPSLMPGANLKVSKLSGNGVTIDELACKTEGAAAGMLGPLAIVSAFGSKHAQLDACAKGPTEVVLRWTAKNGTMSEVKAEGAPAPVAACVERTMARTKVLPAACAARFSLRR